MDSRTKRTYQSGAIYQGEKLNLGQTLENVIVSQTAFIMLKLIHQRIKESGEKKLVLEKFLRIKYKILNILYKNMYKKSLGFWKDKQYSYVEPFLLAQPFWIQQFLFLTPFRIQE